MIEDHVSYTSGAELDPESAVKIPNVGNNEDKTGFSGDKTNPSKLVLANNLFVLIQVPCH